MTLPPLEEIRNPDARRPPRRWARVPSPSRVREWYGRIYEAETGREPTSAHDGRLFAIIEYLSANPGLDVVDLDLVTTSDLYWLTRRTRTPREKQGWLIGTDRVQPGEPQIRLYIVPRKEAWGG